MRFKLSSQALSADSVASPGNKFKNAMITDQHAVLALGFFAQGLFGLRLMVQLFYIEKYRSLQTPVIFWLISICASLLFLLYGLLRGDYVILIGQFVTYYIYLRNLHYQGSWNKVPVGFQLLLLSLAPILLVFVPPAELYTSSQPMFTHTSIIVLIGFLGQLLLNLRFIYQWIYLERHKESLLPSGFWLLSVAGSLLILIYACWHPIHGIDPVLIFAQGMGLLVYLRNLILQHKLSATS